MLCEKYRTKSKDDEYMFDNDMKEILDNMTKNKNMPNLLLYGSSGYGKTSF